MSNMAGWRTNRMSRTCEQCGRIGSDCTCFEMTCCSECGDEVHSFYADGTAFCRACNRRVASTVSPEEIIERSKEINRIWTPRERRKRSGLSVDPVEIMKYLPVTDHRVKRGRIAGK